MHGNMHGFPQGPGNRQRAGIPVENTHFSTFSTDFSTTVFHRMNACGYTQAVDIKEFDGK